MPDLRKHDRDRLDDNKFMDFCAEVWMRLGGYFGVRPATIIGLTIGAVLFATGLTYAIMTSYSNKEDLEPVKTAFCNGSKPLNDAANNRKCRELLTRLINDPSPQQAQRLAEIVRSTE